MTTSPYLGCRSRSEIGHGSEVYEQVRRTRGKHDLGMSWSVLSDGMELRMPYDGRNGLAGRDGADHAAVGSQCPQFSGGMFYLVMHKPGFAPSSKLQGRPSFRGIDDNS